MSSMKQMLTQSILGTTVGATVLLSGSEIGGCLLLAWGLAHALLLVKELTLLTAFIVVVILLVLTTPMDADPEGVRAKLRTTVWMDRDPVTVVLDPESFTTWRVAHEAVRTGRIDHVRVPERWKGALQAYLVATEAT